MMNFKDQVCSLELAEELQNLGVKQESLFSHHFNKNHDRWEMKPFWLMSFVDVTDEHYSAFTIAELLDKIPHSIPYDEHNTASLLITKGPINYTVRYMAAYIFPHRRKAYCKVLFTEKNLVEACAKMLIYLLKNKLITL